MLHHHDNFTYLTSAPIHRVIPSMAVPTIISMLVTSLYNLADTFFVGRINTQATAAIGVVFSLMFFVQAFGFFFGHGSGNYISRELGARRHDNAAKMAATGFVFSFLMGVLIMIVGLLLLRPLSLALGSTQSILPYTMDYLGIVLLGAPFLTASLTLNNQLRLQGNTAYAMVGIVTGAVLNVALDPLLIFVFNLGIRGAAIATVISRAVELVWCIAVSYRKTYLHPQFRHLFLRNKLLSRDFFRLSLPVLGASLLWGVGFTSYTAIVGHLGADAAAAMSIAAVVRDLICCLCNGIASGGSILLGNELGAGNMERGKQYGIWLRNTSFLIGFLSTGIMLLTIPLCDQMILTDQARSYLNAMMTIQAFYLIGRCVNTVTINGVFDGGGDTMFDLYSLAVCMWGIAIPVALLGAFVFHWPVPLVYACTCLDEIGKIPWVMVRFKKYKWLKNLTR